MRRVSPVYSNIAHASHTRQNQKTFWQLPYPYYNWRADYAHHPTFKPFLGLNHKQNIVELQTVEPQLLQKSTFSQKVTVNKHQIFPS